MKGSKITGTRGNKERPHTKNLVKVIKPRTRVNLVKEKTRRRMEEPECLSLDKIKTADKRYNTQQHQHQTRPSRMGQGLMECRKPRLSTSSSHLPQGETKGKVE